MTFPAYNLCAGAGIAFGLALFERRAKRLLPGYDGHVGERALLLIIPSVLAAVVGANLFDRIFGATSGPMIPVRGLAFYGGLIGGGIVYLAGIYAFRLPGTLIADCAAPALALGHAIGRIGCFLGGCCYGEQVPHGGALSALGFQRIPVQLFEAAGLILIAVAVTAYPTRRNGDRFLGYLVLYALLRCSLESLRDDHRGSLSFLGDRVSPSQFVSAMILLGVISKKLLEHRSSRVTPL